MPAELNSTYHENLAETLAKEMKRPELIAEELISADIKRVALPPGWSMKEFDDTRLLPTPIRKTGIVALHDAESFISYMKRHGSLANSTIWCDANYAKGQVKLTGIINDHGEKPDEPDWRDCLATFSPRLSEEWARWTEKDGKPFSQPEFALFIENNLSDIASADNAPTGAQMLEMALDFEAKQDMRFKSAMRLQSGGIDMTFVQDDDTATVEKMKVFERFAIGIPAFWNGDGYRIQSRLRYRVREGKLTFWYELIRPDKTLEAAANTLIHQIKAETGNPFFFGNPFA